MQKYSIGIGDRFGHQGKALLSAIIKAEEQGIDITPVWNKSFREHKITRTKPLSVLREAQNAANALNWKGDYYIDADHINLTSVDLFLDSCNYFTLDISDFIGKPLPKVTLMDFTRKHKDFIGELKLPLIKKSFFIEQKQLEKVAIKYLSAVKEAKQIYNKIIKIKKPENIIIEISMDEAEEAQSPIEMLLILSAISDENLPIQTIAPKFVGKFNKGIDYRGDLSDFKNHLEFLLGILEFAKINFPSLKNIKLSIHSGSDKFSIYPIINEMMKRYKTGIHLKTAGTTWLEELIGLSQAGSEGLKIVKKIYQQAFERYDELSKPYMNVIEINKELLPNPNNIVGWDENEVVECLRHNPSNKSYNPNVRQLLHIGYKIAAEAGTSFKNALDKYEHLISKNVTNNIYENHIKPLFM